MDIDYETTKGPNIFISRPRIIYRNIPRWIENISIPMPVIAVVSKAKSDRTKMLEAITHGLTKKGYRVATASTMSKTDFTTDTKVKDTWRLAEAGAKIILNVVPSKLTITKKVDTAKYHLSDLVKNLNEDEVDVIILDCFRKLVSRDLMVPKIVIVRTAKEAQQASKHFEPILFFAAPTELEIENSRIPKLDAFKEPEKLIERVEQRIGPIVEKRRISKDNLRIWVNKKTLALNPFVHKCVRNVVLAMISTLKGTSIKGDEDISIEIEQIREKQSKT